MRGHIDALRDKLTVEAVILPESHEVLAVVGDDPLVGRA